MQTSTLPPTAVKLRDLVRPYLLRRTKDAVAPELPAKTMLVRAVDLSGAQRELYESIRVAAHADVRMHIKSRGLAGSTIAILDAPSEVLTSDTDLPSPPSDRERDLYLRLIGQHLFGDVEYFPQADKFTLAPLIERGRAALRCDDVSGLEGVLLTEFHRYWGGNFKAIEIRKATDIFGALDDRHHLRLLLVHPRTRVLVPRRL